jgi:hypothetical protein
VTGAMHIATRAQELSRQADLMAKVNKIRHEDVENNKRHIGRAASKTAEDYREHRVLQRDLRGMVDVHTYRYARDTSAPASPLFALFGVSLVATIERMLNVDTAAEKLAEVHKALPDLTEIEDWQIVQRLDLALQQLGERADGWRKRLIAPKKKIVPLPMLPA